MSASPMLFEPELYHTLDADENAYFSIFRKNHTPPQKSFRVECMPDVVRGMQGLTDVYITQGNFRRAQRTIAALNSLGLFWADLGDDGELAKLGDAKAVERILQVTHEADIPYPSFIVGSGRGYHAKWLFTSRVSWSELDRWDALEHTVSRLLRESLNADMKATDAARVLRLVDTFNSKTNTLARIVWKSSENGEMVKYNFEELFRSVVPPDYGTPKKANSKTVATRKHLEVIQGSGLVVPRAPGLFTATAQTWEAKLWLGRLVDERRLFHARGWTPENGGVPQGYRDIALFIGATALTWFAPREMWWNETQSLAAEFAPSLREAEWRGYVSMVWKRMMESQAARAQGFRGEGKNTGRYRFKNRTLAEMLDVSRDEMPLLKHLVDDEEAVRREREYDRRHREEWRRGRGQVDRAAYIAETTNKTLSLAHGLKALMDSGVSLRQAAARLNVSRGSAENAMRVLNDRSC